MSIDSSKVKIMKLFASNKYKKRNLAYKTCKKLLLLKFGDGEGFINEMQIKCIWRGFYTWLYMQDQPILHQEVTGKICTLLQNEIKCDKVATVFIKSFLTIISDEWFNLSKYYFDKFDRLVRFFVKTTFEWFNSHSIENWNETKIALITELLSKAPVDLKIKFINYCISEISQLNNFSSEITTDVIYLILSTVDGVKSVYSKECINLLENKIPKLIDESKLSVNCSDIAEIVKSYAEEENLNGKLRKTYYEIAKMYKTSIKVQKSNVMEVEQDGEEAQEMEVECNNNESQDKDDNEDNHDEDANDDNTSDKDNEMTGEEGNGNDDQKESDNDDENDGEHSEDDDEKKTEENTTTECSEDNSKEILAKSDENQNDNIKTSDLNQIKPLSKTMRRKLKRQAKKASNENIEVDKVTNQENIENKKDSSLSDVSKKPKMVRKRTLKEAENSDGNEELTNAKKKVKVDPKSASKPTKKVTFGKIYKQKFNKNATINTGKSKGIKKA